MHIFLYNIDVAINYYLERNKRNLRSLNERLNELPSFCSLFFIGIENQTTPLTRLNYATDLKVFFNYLLLEEKKRLGIYCDNITQITLDNLKRVDSMTIERFLSYVSVYDNNDKNISRVNTENGKSRKLSTLRSFFGYYFKKNLLDSNVASKVDIPKLHSKPIIRLETDEVSKILDISNKPEQFSAHQNKYLAHCSTRDNAMLTLMLGTGIRVSECVGLNVEDFDFSTNSFKVIRKGGNQTILYFSDEVADVLRNYLAYRATLKLDENEKAMFLSLQNKRLGVRSVENMVKKYAFVTTPLKSITPHKLRSTYGTALYRETGNIYIVADVLGHKDINTTKKHYAAISEDMRKSVANKVKLK